LNAKCIIINNQEADMTYEEFLTEHIVFRGRLSSEIETCKEFLRNSRNEKGCSIGYQMYMWTVVAICNMDKENSFDRFKMYKERVDGEMYNYMFVGNPNKKPKFTTTLPNGDIVVIEGETEVVRKYCENVKMGVTNLKDMLLIAMQIDKAEGYWKPVAT
jgi:hypothetical protein